MDSIIPLGQKNTLAEYMILSGTGNRPPMLDKDLYDFWKIRMELYMQNREHGRMILESVEHGPLIWPTIEENGMTRTKKYAELYATEKIQAGCDMKATNIILQGLPADIYSLERECKLYDAFDKFTHIKGESLQKYYLRFTQLINDMNIYKINMEQFQVNTKFLNSFPPEWSKFVTDFKLVKDLHTTNFDQLHAYLEQHELHANEVHLMHERNQDLDTTSLQYLLVFIQQSSASTIVSTIPIWINSSHSTFLICLSITTLIQSFIHFIITSISVSNESSNLICLAVLVFSPGDDPIACLNKEIAFLTVVASSRFPSTNNQLITSSNLRNQATIQDGRVTVQQVQERQGKSYYGTSYKGNATSSGGNNASGQARVVKCYNCQGEGHMVRQCTQPKRPRNAAWYKEKAMLDPGIPDGQAIQIIILNNVTFQNEDLDTYDSDCDDISNEKAVLMANISNYSSNVISEVPRSETYLNDMENQSLHAMQDFEQTLAMDFTNDEIHIDSNIIPYSQYLQETKQANVQDTNLQAQQDSMTLSVIEQILKQMNKHKAQWIKPTLYDGIVIFDKHVAMPVIDDEETLILEEFRISNPIIESSDKPPIKVEVPSELPKKRTTPNARTEGEWGFEHTKAVFNNEIIPFLKSLKDIFNVFDKDLLNEITEAYNNLLKNYSQLKKHCISHELTIQQNQEIFQQDKSCDNQNALEILEYFKNNDLKAQLQDKDTTICKLKEIIKSLREKSKEENVNHDRCENGTINAELENSVEKLLSENERLCKEITRVKQVFLRSV
ncbi:retrovirus-related pol polyprotein from transposon TNT 1-94 [Tanacetum coccineum]